MTQQFSESGSRQTRQHAGSGFTLIELMIALAVLAILLAIAYPAYTQQIRKARRADAQVALLELTQFMERTYTQCNGYDKAPSACTAAIALPYVESPKDGSSKFYDLSFVAGSVSATTYTLLAKPKAGQAQDRCGEMTIDNLGAKTAVTTDCWR